ncbi:MAG TPA: stage II sporulation protein M [Candidatus Polarisedimenticolia bacterium]|nr:stage II sporulation protein M [Candidatus Polarisedimenticolia bacterium]
MISLRWIEQRRIHWLRLESFVDRSGSRGLQSLPHDELREMALLYRQTAVDLSTVREDPTGARLAEYLNQLLGRAHNVIYRAPRDGRWRVVGFYTWTFPRVFRETFRVTLVSFLMFTGAAIAGWLLASSDPSFQRFSLGPQMLDTIEQGEMWTHRILSIKPAAASGIMTNNIAVSFTMAAAGITAGIGTALLLLFNGVMLGVVGAACLQHGMLLSLCAFVAPHGALELPAIFIAGGAGLLIARGLLFAGHLPRRIAIARDGGRAVQLILGILPMLVLAGMIEGFVSPEPIPEWIRISVGCVLFLALAAYLALAGRRVRAAPSP